MNPVEKISEDEWKHIADLYRQRAAQGDANAMNSLGVMVAEHAVDLMDLTMIEEAQAWFKSAADLGHQPAQQYLTEVWPDAKKYYCLQIEKAKGSGPIR